MPIPQQHEACRGSQSILAVWAEGSESPSASPCDCVTWADQSWRPLKLAHYALNGVGCVASL